MPLVRKSYKRKYNRKIRRRRGVGRKRVGLPYQPRTRYGYMRLTRHSAPVYLNNSAAGSYVVSGENLNSQLQIGTAADIYAQPWGYDIPFSLQFTLGNILNFSELQTLFDYYRILKVEVYVTTSHNVSTASSSNGLPTLCWFRDFDSAAIESPPILRERMGIIRRSFSSDKRTRKMSVVKPKAMLAAFDVATGSTNITAQHNGWLDCNDSNIPHYGLRGMIENAYSIGTANVFSMRFDIKYTIDFKGAR